MHLLFAYYIPRFQGRMCSLLLNIIHLSWIYSYIHVKHLSGNLIIMIRNCCSTHYTRQCRFRSMTKPVLDVYAILCFPKAFNSRDVLSYPSAVRVKWFLKLEHSKTQLMYSNKIKFFLLLPIILNLLQNTGKSVVYSETYFTNRKSYLTCIAPAPTHTSAWWTI